MEPRRQLVGVPNLHFHDLRHTGNTRAVDMGVSLRNLMARMEHDNERRRGISTDPPRLIEPSPTHYLRCHREFGGRNPDGRHRPSRSARNDERCMPPLLPDGPR